MRLRLVVRDAIEGLFRALTSDTGIGLIIVIVMLAIGAVVTS